MKLSWCGRVCLCYKLVENIPNRLRFGLRAVSRKLQKIHFQTNFELWHLIKFLSDFIIFGLVFRLNMLYKCAKNYQNVVDWIPPLRSMLVCQVVSFRSSCSYVFSKRRFPFWMSCRIVQLNLFNFNHSFLIHLCYSLLSISGSFNSSNSSLTFPNSSFALQLRLWWYMILSSSSVSFAVFFVSNLCSLSSGSTPHHRLNDGVEM